MPGYNVTKGKKPERTACNDDSYADCDFVFDSNEITGQKANSIWRCKHKQCKQTVKTPAKVTRL